MSSIPWPLLCIWFALTLLVRAHTFIAPWSDAAVGLYLHMGAEMVRGTLPYVESWEYKPPGAFVPYALALVVTRSFAFAPVLLGIAAVFTSALLIFITAVRLDARHGESAGTFASILYILTSSEEDGLTGDVELFIAPFCLAALALLQCFPSSTRRFFLMGLLAACALQMKLMALPSVLFLLAVLMFIQRKRLFVPLGAACIGFTLPVLLEIVVYAHAGHLGDLYDANVGATLRRLAFRSREHGHGNGVLVAQILVLSPMLELAIAGFFLGTMRKVWLFAVWFLVQSAALVLVGEYDYRQFITLVPIIALPAGFALEAIVERLPRPRVFVALMILLAFGLHAYYTVMRSALYAYHHFLLRDDRRSENADDLLARELPALLHGDRSVFFVNVSPVLYDILDIKSPTRYLFTQNLLDRSKWSMLGFDGSRELRRILAEHPHYVLLTAMRNAEFDPAVVRDLRGELSQQYVPIAIPTGDVLAGYEFYRRWPR
jgi:hypothetical protein